MKKLPPYLILCMVCSIYISCLNTNSKKNSPENITRITSDELIYEMKITEEQTITQFPLPDTTKKENLAKLDNSTSQEMLVIYSYLNMSENQILLFENQFQQNVKESSQDIPTQNEIQEIMDASFELVLTKEQFNIYKKWRVGETQ